MRESEAKVTFCFESEFEQKSFGRIFNHVEKGRTEISFGLIDQSVSLHYKSFFQSFRCCQPQPVSPSLQEMSSMPMDPTLTKMNETSSNALAKLVVNQCESNQNFQNVNIETLNLILQNVKAKENESFKQQWCENNQVDDSDSCEIIETPPNLNQQSQILPDVKTLTEILHNVSSSSMQNAKEIESIWENAMREAKAVDQEVIDLVSDEDPGIHGEVKTWNKLHQNVSSMQNVTALTEIPRESVTKTSINDLNSDDENIESHIESLEEDDDPGVPGEIKCEHCEMMFMTKNELKSHVKDMIDPHLIFECNKTDCPFETNLMCAWHRHFHSHVKLLCNFCLVAFSSKTELDGHYKSQHEIQNNQEGKNDHKCKSCSQEFNSLESKESHTCREYHQCNYCESMFLSRQDVNIHMKNEHGHKKKGKRKNYEIEDVQMAPAPEISDLQDCQNPFEKFFPEVIKPKVYKMKLNLSFAKKIAENKCIQSSHTSETDEEFDL